MALSKQAAMEMLESDDLVGIGMAAHAKRMEKNDPRVVTYQIDRNINYTNFCTEYCSFCAFYRPLGAKDGYILSLEEIYKKIEEMLELGGTGVLLQGGLHPDLQIEYYENLLRSLKSRFPQVHLHCFSAPEILCIAEVSELSVGRYHPAPDGCGIAIHSRGRRGNSGRRNSRENSAAEMHQRRLGIRAPHCAQAGIADDGDNDVWLRRGASAPGKSF